MEHRSNVCELNATGDIVFCNRNYLLRIQVNTARSSTVWALVMPGWRRLSAQFLNRHL